MPSLKQHAGYLQIDHRDSPGLTPEQVAHVPGAMAVGAGRMLERDVLTCSHCERAVVLQPLRTRDRGYCQKCDHYICDHCESIRVKTGACVPMRQIVDAILKGDVSSMDHIPASPLALAVPTTPREARLAGIIEAGRARYDEADWDGADPYFRELLREGVSPSTVYAALATIAFYQGKRDEAKDFATRAADCDREHQDHLDNLVMFVDADPAATPQDAYNVRQRWWEVWGAKHYAARQPLTNDRNPDRPLRVGYCSGDFCHHSACSVFGPFVLNHSSGFETYFYSSTESYAHDPTTQMFKDSPNWRHVWGESDEHVAELIRRDQIDILIDLSGFTANNRLGVFARKVAPVQITGWGYGTGLSWPVGVMDYLVADATVVPPNHADITERIALFPSVLPYFPPNQYPSMSTPLPSLTQPPTFGVFQRALKINDETLEAWRLILERLPAARLIIKGDYCRTFVERMQSVFAAFGDRVAIVNLATSKQEHLEWWRKVDVALDTWPQSGGVASCEALWHGIPIVTYQGQRLMSRVASSLLTNLGLEEFIATTPEGYVQTAIRAITQTKRLQEVRQQLPGLYAAWVERADYLQAVENFYRSAWQTWCQS